jgi:replicative DNA helicase
MKTNLDYALEYVNNGISIFPVWSREMVANNPPGYYIENFHKALDKNEESENPKTQKEFTKHYFINQCKIPLIKWKEYQSRFPTEEEVKSWFDQWPDANIGVVTGKISNLVVFDLDSQKAFNYAQEQGGFPDTVRVKTGKGEHVWVKYPEFFIKPDVNKKLDMDIRGDGGFVVAPPSFHGSGNQYQWIEDHALENIEIAQCSPWMIQYLKDNATGRKKTADKKPAHPKNNSQESTAPNEIADIIKNGCEQGHRNHTATKLIGSLIKTNKDRDVAWEFTKLWNSKNKPPLNESELRNTFDSIAALEGEDKKKEDVKIDVSLFLDSKEQVLSDYNRKNKTISFAGDNLHTLEEKMNGGLQCGCFYILGGIPSAGKTLLTNNIADNICLNGYPVLFFSYDDVKSELRHRSFSRFSKRDIEDFNKKNVSKKSLQCISGKDEIKRINENKYIVQDMIPVNKWSDLISQVNSRHNKPPVILIDYLRKLKLEKSNSDERLRVDGILTYLTDLAKKHNIPILAISELARDSYKSGQRLSMASFKESGTIEYEASWLGILAAVEEKNGVYHLKENWERIIEEDGNIDLIVFKAKRGTGATGKIHLKFNKKYMVVEDRIEDNNFVTIPAFVKKSKYA